MASTARLERASSEVGFRRSSVELRNGALGKSRTPDPPGRSRPLCPLSYEGNWRCRPVSSRLMTVLQTVAFPFRHCTIIGREARFRTQYLRVQSATLYRLSYFPMMVRVRCSDHRPPRSKRGALPHELHPVMSAGAHGRTRTRIFNSDYGSPVRSRRRLRARGRAGGPRSRVTILRGSYPVRLDDGPVMAPRPGLEPGLTG
jgi:hypothetical protein